MWTPLHADARAAFGHHGAVVVAVLYAPLDVRFFDDLDRLLDDVSATVPGAVSILLVRSGASPGKMSPEVRDRTRALLGQHSSRLRGFAYVNAGSGLKATLLRGAMNTALLAAGFNGKVFTSVDDALGWIAALPGQPAEVARAVPEVRRVVDELERTRG